MGTEVRYDIYDLFLKQPEPLVPRRLRFDIEERLAHDGSILKPLSEASVEQAAHQMMALDVESVAICFLHSFRHKLHEEAARQIIERVMASSAVSISSEVAPEIREYHRMSTTVANAYVQPITRTYVDDLEQRLQQRGFPRHLFLMLSSGGITTSDTAKRFPIRLAESGPAAGVLATTFLGRRIGIDSFVSFDMGGTTAKIGVVTDGQPSMAGLMEIARVHRFKKGSGIPIKIPVIELIEIGAGGGSIAYVDALGLLKVGPQSAGAEPGPACYALGGSQPTVTDANVLLGYLSPESFLGGSMTLDADAARDAIFREVAQPLEMEVTEAARGIYEIVNQNMLSAMKVHIAERGEDPRRFYLFAFGGAGPAHAYELARMLGMRGILVPPAAGAASALGLVTAAVSFEFARSYVTRLRQQDQTEIWRIFDEMEAEGRAVLKEAGVTPESPEIRVIRSLDLRHKGQGHELNVVIPEEVYRKGSIEALKSLFYERYQDKYGHAHTHLPVELITCRCVVRGPRPPLSLKQDEQFAEDTALKGERPVYFVEAGGFMQTPVYDRYSMGKDMKLNGPAIVEERECTVVVGPSALLTVDPYGNLIIDLGEAG
jgi:N-methylhydantoinase A/oxoprolinase/acetone carboxylase beta subunit